MPETDVIAAVATAAGPAGIAVVRLSGGGCARVAARVFAPKNRRKSIGEARGYTAMYGEFIADGRVLDDGVALCFRAPHSYTGEDTVELCCHGGDAVSGALLAACVLAGARPAAAGEFTRRAFENGRLSLTQAEAVMELVGAASRQGAAAAAAALGGALHRELCGIKERLVSLAGRLAALADYPEEDLEELGEGELFAALAEAGGRLDALISQYGRGAALRRGVHTAIVGAPNVGKSTVFNLLSGFECAIVADMPGTTRDVVRQQITVGGVALHLADTAGLREAGGEVEREGVRRSEAELEQAALVLAVFDGSEPLSGSAMDLARLCAGRAALAVVNKSDLPLRADPGALAPFFSDVTVVSALSKDTAQILERAILNVLGLRDIDPAAPMLQNARQLAAAVAARGALADASAALESGLAPDAAAVCVDDALRALCDLTGERADEAVLREVFSRFCVGK